MIVGALLARNEAGPDRWLVRALDHMARFVDGIVVLDDASTDATDAVCRQHPSVLRVVSTRNEVLTGGNGVINEVLAPPPSFSPDTQGVEVVGGTSDHPPGGSQSSGDPVGCGEGLKGGGDYAEVGWGGDRASCGQPEAATATLEGGWWRQGRESVARAALWQLACEAAGENGWVLVFDADMLLEGILPNDLKRLTLATAVNAWAWPLCDCWDGEQQHRVDGYWQGWRVPRVWLARAHPMPDFVPSWGTRGIHSGHLPANYPLVVGVAPGAYWRHLSYISPEHRAAKLAAYTLAGV